MKIKRLLLILITITLLFTTNSKVFACDEEKTNTYITQILFGSDALNKQEDEKVKMLLDALYLCSEQSDSNGQEQLDNLKKMKVSGLPSLDALNIESSSLYECSHSSWMHPYSEKTDKKASRKKVLQSTVRKVFGVNFFNQWFGENKEKCERFAELLYYLHILIDYPAESPYESPLKGKNSKIPEYSGKPYIFVNDNRPSFTQEEFDHFKVGGENSGLDVFGRAGSASVLITPDSLETIGPREDIGSLKPSGYVPKNYVGIVPGNAQLYNKCHLLAHELTGKEILTNLVTGTRYMNVSGMKQFEDLVANRVKEFGFRVYYRATPIYDGNNEVALGIQLEAYSSEDPICRFNVFCYNVQPGIAINYADGQSAQLDTCFNKEGVIPFAVSKASKENPDLLFELKNVLNEVFKHQKESTTMEALNRELTKIENDARELVKKSPNTDSEKWVFYYQLKPLQNKCLEVLKSFVPFLMQNEELFEPITK